MWSLSSRTPSAPSRLPSKPVRPSGPVGGVKGRGEGGSDYGCVLASSQLVLLSATPPHKTSFQALLLRTTDVNQMRSAAEMVLAAYHACNSVNHHSPHSKDPLPALSIFRTASVRATSASNTGSARASTASWSDRGGSAASATSATSLAASSRDADPVKALLLEREGAREAEALGHLAFAAVAGHALLVFVPIANHWVHPASNVDPVEHLARSLQEPWYLHMNHVARVFDETEINMACQLSFLTTFGQDYKFQCENSTAYCHWIATLDSAFDECHPFEGLDTQYRIQGKRASYNNDATYNNIPSLSLRSKSARSSNSGGGRNVGTMGSRHSTAGGSRDDSGYVGGGGDEEMGSLGRGRDQQTVKLSHNAYQQPYLHQQHQHQQVRKKVSSESMRRNAELLESSMTSNARKNGLHKSVRRTSTSLGDEWDEALQLLERLDSFKDDPISVHPTLKDMISKSPKLSRMASFKADMTVVAAEDVIPAVNRPTLPKQVNEAVPRHQLEKRASQSDFFFLPASERSITAPTTDSNDALSYPTAFTPSASFSPDRAHVPSNQTQVGKMVSQSEMASPPKSPKRHASVQAFPDDKTPVASPGRKSLASSRSEPDMRNQPPGSDEELDVAPVRCVTPKSSKGSLKAGSVKTSTPDYSGEGLKPRSSNASLTSTSADGVAKGSRTVTPRSSDTSLAVTKVTGTSAPKQDKSVKLRSSTISLNSISANYPANANLAPPRRKNLKPKLSDTSIRVTYTQQNDAATESTTMSSIVPILEYAEGTITPSLTAAHPTLRTRSEHLKADRASRRSSAFVTSLRETTERILKDTGVLEVGGGSVSAGLGVEDAVSARSVLKNQLKSLLDTEMVRKTLRVTTPPSTSAVNNIAVSPAAPAIVEVASAAETLSPKPRPDEASAPVAQEPVYGSYSLQNEESDAETAILVPVTPWHTPTPSDAHIAIGSPRLSFRDRPKVAEYDAFVSHQLASSIIRSVSSMDSFLAPSLRDETVSPVLRALETLPVPPGSVPVNDSVLMLGSRDFLMELEGETWSDVYDGSEVSIPVTVVPSKKLPDARRSFLPRRSSLRNLKEFEEGR